MKNALLEAAAEILKASQSSAPKEEMHKMPGEVQDLGGDTPESHSDAKLDVRAKEATPPGKQAASDTKAPLETVAGKPATATDPSECGEESADQKERKARIEAGLAKGDLKEEKEEEKDEDEDKDEDKEEGSEKHEKKEKELIDKLEKLHEDWKKGLKEDVAKILASESTLPKEFASKIGTIYEARVTDKVASIQEQLEAQYAESFEAAVLEVRDSLTEQVNDYLSYVVEEWMKQNELAIEKGLRSELTEEFIGGLRNLFIENYIDIPAEKVDVVDELATKVEELTSQLNEEVAKSVELKKQLSESKKSEILNSVCEGLTQTQVEKVRTLAESVEFTAEGDYTSKVSTIRENYFPVSTGKKTDTNAKMLTEASEPLAEEKTSTDPSVASVAAAIAKSLK
jgi:hypothetical protein